MRADSKAQVLITWLHENLKPDGEWGTKRVVIFTEYRETQEWLIERLSRLF
jgi:ERCC4-related helicase